MSGLLIRSLLLSAVLTILLNAFMLWRGRQATGGSLDRLWSSASEEAVVEGGDDADDRPTVRVFVPWKAMLIGSIGLTVVLNVVIWLAR